MLSWCAYCQEFQGDLLPFDTLAVTHGICEACAETALTLTDRELHHARALQRIQAGLSDEGQQNDLSAAARVLDEAMAAQIRAVDVLLGIVAPMLCQIGEDWRRAVVTVAQEHRFAAFCQEVVTLVESRLHADADAKRVAAGPVEALLMNAPGNRHTLGIHVLRLWLLAKGLHGRVLAPSPRAEEVAALVQDLQPRLLLISMAMAEHAPVAQVIVERIRALPGPSRTRIIAGGNAVKQGQVASIPGVELVPDIHALPTMLAAWAREAPRTAG